MTGLELFLASHLLLTPISGQPAVICPVQKNVRVDVNWRSEPVRYDMSQGYEDLGGKAISSANPYGTHVATDVGGLMSGKVTYKSGIQISSIRYPASNVTCLWVDRIIVDIVIDPTIFVARENPKGSCKYIAILEHESKHVATDRAVVQDHINAIRAMAQSAGEKVGVVGPKPDSSVEAYKTKMSAYIEGMLKSAVDDLYADRTKRQQALDNRKEYDRVEAQCADKK